MNWDGVLSISGFFGAIRLGFLSVFLLTPAAQAAAQTTVWDGQSLPVTIEVSQDVPVRTSERRPGGSYGQERGSLYSRTALLIGAAQRFEMIEILGEGGCRIRFDGSEYELSSCPWLPGFRDHQTDIFRIVDAPQN